ncbi:MAG: amino acid ABC transporter permease [Alphaproteobacteria bacterium]|nr:amino acid ABC transporter permease [Alphaproteobacteria bacterium]
MAGQSKIEAYIRTEMAPTMPPPASTVGIVGWMRANLFSDWINTVLTLIGMYLVYITLQTVIDWAFIRAVWTGEDNKACLDKEVGFHVGACWAFVGSKFSQFVYGRYPLEERWRVDITFLVGAVGLAWMIIENAPYRKWVAIFMLALFPLMALILLTGGNFELSSGSWKAFSLLSIIALVGVAFVGVRAQTKGSDFDLSTALMIPAAILAYIFLAYFLVDFDFGMAPVETSQWGGLLVTLVVAITGIVASLPIGILLALGRRSEMPVVRMASVIFIEFWRGVPLITVLFMSSVMLPLFLPEGVNFDKLLRCLIGVALFSAAYMAEVVRGGLQAIPKGQYEGAMALGLPFWKMMGLIVLPQALKLVIPGIVNTFIGLFKDTTLVLIIGLFDLLGIIQLNVTADAKWFAPSVHNTGYVFAGLSFWIFCFGMSRYSIYMENKLHTGHKR